VAHGQDVDGTPFEGERVCFYVDHKADSYRLFSGVTGPANARFRVNTVQAPTPDIIDPDVRCAYLDRFGNAALEVFNSDPDKVNVIAEYIDEGLLRDRDVDYSAPVGDPTPPPGTPPVGGDPTPSTPRGGAGSNPPTHAQAVATMGPQAAARVSGSRKATKRTRVARASIVRTSKGRYLTVRISSSKKTAKIRIRLLGKNGKTVARVTRTVKTNRTVRVMKVGAKVKSARVTLAR